MRGRGPWRGEGGDCAGEATRADERAGKQEVSVRGGRGIRMLGTDGVEEVDQLGHEVIEGGCSRSGNGDGVGSEWIGVGNDHECKVEGGGNVGGSGGGRDVGGGGCGRDVGGGGGGGGGRCESNNGLDECPERGRGVIEERGHG